MLEKPTLMDLLTRPTSFPSTPQKIPKKAKLVSNNDLEDDPLHKILSWRDPLQQPQTIDPDTYKLKQVGKIVEAKHTQWGSSFQGILIDADWDTLPFQQFKRLRLPEQLINNGIVFIWGASDNIEELFDYFTEQGFQYVQNFMFVMLDRAKIPAKKRVAATNNLFNYFKKTAAKQEQQQKEPTQPVRDYETGRIDFVQEIFMERPGQYLKQTQRVLYMFRKHHKTEPLQLRHQRTSDAFFTIGDNWQLDWKSMEAVYRMIETLLIKANYQKGKPLRLLELWGKTGPRKGWVTVQEHAQ